MIPDEVKKGLKEVASKVASGKMKPGDSLVVAGKNEPDGDEGDMSMFHSLAEDFMQAFESKDIEGLASLLQELCQHSKSY